MSTGAATMNETSFASLSPTLLARKGGARPAMRPQHGGLLGSIGSAPDQDNSPEENLDDLGWNDMGDEHEPHHDADVIKLTPSPVNAETAAQARQMDEQTDARLAEIAGSNSPARNQQEVLAKRIEKKSPPILSDAIMSNDDEDDDEQDEQVFGAEYEAEDDLGLNEAEYDDSEYFAADYDNDDFGDVSAEPDRGSPQITAVKPARPARAHRIAAVDQGKRAAFTLRLDAERHLQLRLASTICGHSAQQIVTDALDAFLAEMPELATLAAQVKRPGTENS